MKVIVLLIVICVRQTTPKILINGAGSIEIGGQAHTFQIGVSLRSARILRRVLKTWGNLLSLRSQWKTSVNCFEKTRARQYVSKIKKKEGGKGLANIKDIIDASIQRLEDYIE